MPSRKKLFLSYHYRILFACLAAMVYAKVNTADTGEYCKYCKHSVFLSIFRYADKL